MKYLSTADVAKQMEVGEETVRRWIRGGGLRAKRMGKQFMISEWDLQNFVLVGGRPLYNQPELLTLVTGIPGAMLGAILFDKAYFGLELQWERIQQDYNEIALTRERQENEDKIREKNIREWAEKIRKASMSEAAEIISQRPRMDATPNYWSVPQKSLFMDLHFYAVAADNFRKSIHNRLIKDIKDAGLQKILDKYAAVFDGLNEIRRHFEHADERITQSRYARDFFNLDDKGLRFGGKYYDLYIEELRKCHEEICDYLLLKSLPELES